jgi:menaquinone-dependent protoporphyrinogen IX oxidase
MQKTLIIYESKYGSTEEVAKEFALVLGPAKYIKTADFKRFYEDFHFIVLGSPIYSGEILPEMSVFIEENLHWLKTKKIALFCTCISPEDGREILFKLEKILGEVVSSRALGGILKLDKLDRKDSESLKAFSKMVGFPLVDANNFNREDVINYALELKSIKDNLIPQMPLSELKKSIEAFLTSHNTCTLSTAHKERVRSTPIEYTYQEGHIYLLSEGGEKFANISLNSAVSVAVYEDYTTMNNLAGMQISGTASLVHNDAEYKDIISMKGLNPDIIQKMPFNMNLIKIKIRKVEFLYSKFRERGYGVKQILRFD